MSSGRPPSTWEEEEEEAEEEEEEYGCRSRRDKRPAISEAEQTEARPAISEAEQAEELQRLRIRLKKGAAHLEKLQRNIAAGLGELQRQKAAVAAERPLQQQWESLHPG